MSGGLPDGYTLSLRTPEVADYMRLRAIAGLTAMSVEGAEAGLPNSWRAVVMAFEGRPIGMGRVIGDGGLFFQITDIAVDPAHQGRGLGKAIVAALTTELRRHAPARAYVSLMADGEAHRLYAQYGFQPTAPRSIGMAFIVPET